MFQVPGSETLLPAVQIPTAATSALGSWVGGYVSVRLTEPIDAACVQMEGGTDASLPPDLAGAGPAGRWFALDGVTALHGDYRPPRTLPAHFSLARLATLLPGTVVNVGSVVVHADRGAASECLEYVLGPWPLVRSYDDSRAHHEGP